MSEFKSVSKKHVPCCPNHGEPLYGLPNPIPNKGIGRCPVSNCAFAYEIETNEGTTKREVDKYGNIKDVKTYKVTGEEKELTEL